MKHPKRGEYYFNFGKCAPMKAKRLCHGDCLDCYLHDMYHYEKYLKKNNLQIGPDDTNTPPRCPIMARGRVIGKVTRYFLKAPWQKHRTEVVKEQYIAARSMVGITEKTTIASFHKKGMKGWVEENKLGVT